ncbi:hypothetical protein B566_EDAN014246, partial [Ephemera danica]
MLEFIVFYMMAGLLVQFLAITVVIFSLSPDKTLHAFSTTSREPNSTSKVPINSFATINRKLDTTPRSIQSTPTVLNTTSHSKGSTTSTSKVFFGPECKNLLRPGDSISIDCHGNGDQYWISIPEYLTKINGKTIATTPKPEYDCSQQNHRPTRQIQDGESGFLGINAVLSSTPNLELYIEKAQFNHTGTYICRENDKKLIETTICVSDLDNCKLLVPIGSSIANNAIRHIDIVEGERFVLPCRATHSAENIEAKFLYEASEGFVLRDNEYKEIPVTKYWECIATYGKRSKKNDLTNPVPQISGPREVKTATGETLSLECKVYVF